MTVEIITGYNGTAHISAADDGEYQSGVSGTGNYVFNISSALKGTIDTSTENRVYIANGSAMFNGRHVRLYDSDNYVVYDGGTQTAKRRDAIVLHYSVDESGVESVALEIIKGTAGKSATDPTIPSGTIRGGASDAYMLLYYLELNGVNASLTDKRVILHSSYSNETLLYNMRSASDSTAKAAMIAAVRDAFFPVGSTYTTVENVNPSKRFGGTWTNSATYYVAQQGHSDSISYNAHVQNIGWQKDEDDRSKWFKNGAMCGTSGKSYRVEALRIAPTTARAYTKIYVWKRTA